MIAQDSDGKFVLPNLSAKTLTRLMKGALPYRQFKNSLTWQADNEADLLAVVAKAPFPFIKDAFYAAFYGDPLYDKLVKFYQHTVGDASNANRKRLTELAGEVAPAKLTVDHPGVIAAQEAMTAYIHSTLLAGIAFRLKGDADE